MTVTVLVTGSRDWAEPKRIIRDLTMLYEAADGDMVVMEGGARGADRIAREWAMGMDEVTSITIPANWDRDGRAAGPIRNKLMLELVLKAASDSTVVLAYPLPGGKGTKHMMKIAEEAGLLVVAN